MGCFRISPGPSETRVASPGLTHSLAKHARQQMTIADLHSNPDSDIADDDGGFVLDDSARWSTLACVAVFSNLNCRHRRSGATSYDEFVGWKMGAPQR